MQGCNNAPELPIENVILITLDTTRSDALGAYGNKLIRTPVLDEMAQLGHRFDECYTHAPITLPSHSSILTGMLPPVHGVRNNIAYALPEDTRTLPEMLKDHGFDTAAFIGSFILDSRFGLDQGFDVYEDNIVHYSQNKKQKDIVTRRAGKSIDLMLDWLSAREKPFFSWLHLYDAHAPYDPPLPFRQAYAGTPYYGEIAYMDYEMGRLVRHLKERGIYHKTLIVVTADHGESFNEHDEQTHGFFCYAATTHVPLILSQPLYGKVGKQFEHRVQSIDLVPSILDALGLPPEQGLQGLRLDNRKDRSVYSEAIIPQEDFYLAPVHSFKDKHYSFYFSSDLELYDLSVDPRETHNLAPLLPRLLTKYQARMEVILKDAISTANTVQVDQESIELLRSLGYIADGGTSVNKESNPFKYRSPYASVDTYRELQELRLFEHSFPYKMIDGLKLLLKKDRRQLILYRELGRLSALAGHETDAIENLKKAAHLKPEDPRLHTFLGLGYHHFGHFDESITEFKLALKIDDTHAVAYYNLGLSQMAKDDVHGAVASFSRAVELNGSDLFSLNNLAFIYLQHLKQPQKAWTYINKAHALNQNHPLVKANRARIEAALK